MRFFVFVSCVCFFFVVRARYRYIIKHPMFIHRFEFFVVVIAVAAVCSVENNEDRPRNHLVKETEKAKTKKKEIINKSKFDAFIEWIGCQCQYRMIDSNVANHSNSIIEHEQCATENGNTYHVTFCVNYIGTIDQHQWKLKPIARVFTFLHLICLVSFCFAVSCSWIFIQSIHVALKKKNKNKNSHE